jgi:hypothetical protein
MVGINPAFWCAKNSPTPELIAIERKGGAVSAQRKSFWGISFPGGL